MKSIQHHSTRMCTRLGVALLSVLFLLVIASHIHCQSWELELGHDYLRPSATNSIENITPPANGGFQSTEIVYNYSTITKPSHGLSLGLHREISVNDRWDYSLGVSFRYSRFSFWHKQDDLPSFTVSTDDSISVVDTIVFEGDGENEDEFDFENPYSIVRVGYIGLPLKMGYTVPNSRFALSLGLNPEILVWEQTERAVAKRISDPQTIFGSGEWIESRVTEDGSDFSSISLETGMGVSYSIRDHLSISLNVYRTIIAKLKQDINDRSKVRLHSTRMSLVIGYQLRSQS